MRSLLSRLGRRRDRIMFGLESGERRRAVWCCGRCGTTEHGPSLMDAEAAAVGHNVLCHRQRLAVVGDHHLAPEVLR